MTEVHEQWLGTKCDHVAVYTKNRCGDIVVSEIVSLDYPRLIDIILLRTFERRIADAKRRVLKEHEQIRKRCKKVRNG